MNGFLYGKHDIGNHDDCRKKKSVPIDDVPIFMLFLSLLSLRLHGFGFTDFSPWFEFGVLPESLQGLL